MRYALFALILCPVVLSAMRTDQAVVAAQGNAAGPATTRVLSLDGDGWLLAVDPQNVGQQEEWFRNARREAKPTRVPWIIQDAFPAYHGVAWYWRDFTAPLHPDASGRYLLRFWAVDYKADVWLNGTKVGEHEDGESPFVLDVTRALKPRAANRLAVRVLNPTDAPIDGIALGQTPHRNKKVSYTAGSSFDQGGIVDSVELLAVPAARVDELFVRPDLKTGIIRIQTSLVNAEAQPAQGRIELSVAPAAGGETLAVAVVRQDLPSGNTLVDTQLRLSNAHRWDLNDPFLYRVTARLTTADGTSADERSVRCGFRDFRFDHGSFRLNGRRIYLRCSHTGNHCPIGLQLPHDPDLIRRDLLNVKVMGFNAVRFIAGVATRHQLDLCDEIGLMVYEEPYAAWCLGDSPKMGERFNASLLGMVRRDRNHPSVTIWGLLNETGDGSVFRHAVGSLAALRALDDSRLVLLNSGRWDRGRKPAAGTAPEAPIGSLSNPGSAVWEDVMNDLHDYPHVPHTESVVHALRTKGQGGMPLLLSEYGIGSGVDLVRVVRHYERLGKANLEDAQFYRIQRDRFLEDWERWQMAEAFGRPEEFFAQSLQKMASQRLVGLNAIRANPFIIGHSLTGTVDQGMTGEGLTTTFRELKPGTIDAVFDAWAPLRWCLFAEPANAYRKTPVRLEAVLANEDALAPGEYSVRLQVVGPNLVRVFDRVLKVKIADCRGKPEPPMVLPVFAEDAVIDGPSGKYRFLATFERGAAAAGGLAEFTLTDPAEMPPVEAEVVLWGEDPVLAQWLKEHGIRTRPLRAEAPAARELILACGKVPAPGGAKAFGDLASRMARGATVVFLTPAVFAEGKTPTRWLPLRQKGTIHGLPRWLYLSDDWAKNHPIFDGLPAGGLLDYGIYRELIADQVWSGQEPPAEAVAGANNVSCGYDSGLTVSVYNLGAGRFILNSLRIRENLGHDPVAQRLLRNMLRFGSRDLQKPLANLPADSSRLY